MSYNYLLKNKKDRALQIQEMLQDVLIQAKLISNLTWEEMANKFDVHHNHNYFTADFLRQYAAGRKSVSLFRYKNILSLLVDCGFSNQYIIERFEDIENLEILQATLTNEEVSDFLEKKHLMIESSEQSLKTKAFNKLKNAIKSVVELDFNDAEIMYMVSTLLETEVPAHNRTFGAAVISPHQVMGFQVEKLVDESPVVMCWRVAKS